MRGPVSILEGGETRDETNGSGFLVPFAIYLPPSLPPEERRRRRRRRSLRRLRYAIQGADIGDTYSILASVSYAPPILARGQEEEWKKGEDLVSRYEKLARSIDDGDTDHDWRRRRQVSDGLRSEA